MKAHRVPGGLEIESKLWIKLPKKAPKTATLKIVVSDLTMTDKVNIDPALFESKDPEAATGELLKSFFLCSLLSLGIFNVPAKKEAFRLATGLQAKAQGASL
jgi:hypothetical protein